MSLEEDLRRALEREPAPDGFADRLLAKTTTPERRVMPVWVKPVWVTPMWRRPLTLAIAAALALGVMIPSGIYEYRQRQRGMQAKEQLMVALVITKAQLQQARGRINEGSRHKL